MSHFKLLSLIKLAWYYTRKRKTGVECRDFSTCDINFRVYRSKRSVHPVLLLHGLSMQGKDDHRLDSLAYALSRLGFTAYTMDIPGLVSLQYTADDINVIRKAVKYIADTEGTRVSLAAFSIGASYALLAASDSPARDNISCILSAGAYYNAGSLFRLAEKKVEDDPYGFLVLAYNHNEVFDLDASERRTLEILLKEYCSREGKVSETEKQLTAKVIATVRNTDVFQKEKELLSGLQEINLSQEAFRGISSEVLLLHSKNDPMVPASESLKIYQGLRGAGAQVSMKNSGGASHMDFFRGELFPSIYIFSRFLALSADG